MHISSPAFRFDGLNAFNHACANNLLNFDFATNEIMAH